MVVALHVIGAHDELDVESLFEVEELFLFVAHDEVDFVNPPHAQLADLALDEHFAAHDEHSLGAIVGDGRQAARQAGRQDHGVFHFVGLKRQRALVRDAVGVREAVSLKRAIDRVDRSDRKAREFGDLALIIGLAFHQRPQNKKLIFSKHANNPFLVEGIVRYAFNLSNIYAKSEHEAREIGLFVFRF